MARPSEPDLKIKMISARRRSVMKNWLINLIFPKQDLYWQSEILVNQSVSKFNMLLRFFKPIILSLNFITF